MRNYLFSSLALLVVGVIASSSSSSHHDPRIAVGVDHVPVVYTSGRLEDLPAGDNINVGAGALISQMSLTTDLQVRATCDAGTPSSILNPVVNDWVPACASGPAWPNVERVQVHASDNFGTVLLGLSSAGVTTSKIVTLCNTNSTSDDGVLALVNESPLELTAANRFKLPDTGVMASATVDRYYVTSDSCVRLLYQQVDKTDPTSTRWVVQAENTRSEHTISQLAQWFPDLTTAPITGTVNDWAPSNTCPQVGGPLGTPATCEAGGSTSFDDYSVIRTTTVDASGATITGLHWTTNAFQNGLGPWKLIVNYGPGPIVLANQNAGSSLYNRFLFSTGADITLPVNGSVLVRHSSIDGVWVLAGTPPYTAGTSIAISPAQRISVNVAGVTCTAGQALVSQTTGAAASCGAVAGTIIGRQVLTANSGTYTPTPGTTAAILEGVGQGGGGGGCAGGVTGSAAGAGGASGAYIRVYVACGGACTGGAFVNGHTGGAGGAAGNNPGADGQDTTIVFNGVTYVMTHGRGGAGMPNATTGQSALGGFFAGTSTTADVNLDQVPGGSSWSDGAGHGMSGYGGSSPWGAGGAGESSVQGGAFLSHGAGAGGAGPFCTTTSFAGGNATNGQIIITEIR